MQWNNGSRFTGDAVDTEWVGTVHAGGCSGHSELQFPGVRCSGCYRFTEVGTVNAMDAGHSGHRECSGLNVNAMDTGDCIESEC